MKCNFDKLWLFINKQLEPEEQLAVLNHLEECEICCEAICNIARDQATDHFIRYYLSYRLAS